MEIIRAETAGFCMGVDLALQKLDRLIARTPEGESLLTLGPIIHNPQVLESYRRLGVDTVSSPDDIPMGGHVVIRAHGIPKHVLERLKARKAHIIDATCPKVRKAQHLIARMAAERRIVLLFGEECHPEVKGLLSYAEAGAFIFDSAEALEEFPFNRDETYCLAAQTTQDREEFLRIADLLRRDPKLDIEVLETVCDATRNRQQEAIRLAREVDFVVVLGGLTSGNTRRLAQVVRDQGTACVHVETVADCALDELAGYRRIGLTAGASTPKIIIDEAQAVLENL